MGKGNQTAPRWYQMAVEDESAEIYIFGDVTSWAWEELGEVSAHGFVSDLAELGDVDSISVHINSYGGEVGEGIAIYNALVAHPAKVTTVCEGMACSIASVIFMAGDERVMRDASMLFLHDCWTWGHGDSDDMRKLADDLDKQNELSKLAYARSGSDSETIAELMRNDTWLSSSEALEMGFATGIDETAAASSQQSALPAMAAILMGDREREEAEEPIGEPGQAIERQAGEPEPEREPSPLERLRESLRRND